MSIDGYACAGWDLRMTVHGFSQHSGWAARQQTTGKWQNGFTAHNRQQLSLPLNHVDKRLKMMNDWANDVLVSHHPYANSRYH